MQNILDRVQGFLEPFQCQFTISSAVQPQMRKPPLDLPPELWLEIFQFATYVHRSANIKPLDPFTVRRTSNNVMGVNTPALALQTKLALVDVCKSWRRLAMPVLYQHIVVRSPMRAKLILQVLEQSRKPFDSPITRPRDYGQWTHHIEVFTHARGCSNLKYLQTIFSIFRCCPNLRILSGIWIHLLPPEFLEVISRLYGQSLEGMYWNETSEKMNRPQQTLTTSATLSFLTSFRSLQTLDLRHFKAKDPLQELSLDSDTSRPTLPLVQDLIVSTHSWSLSTATRICLPRLHTLTVKTNIPDNTDHYQLSEFLKVHGRSLQSVDLRLPSPDDLEPDSSLIRRTAKHVNPDLFLQPDTCPNLVSIVFPVTSPALGDHVHPSLRRIGLRGVRADSLYPDRSGTVQTHLHAIHPDRYPNLELVQTIGFLVEAEGDYLIKDIFIWWVEKFEKQGINFLDGEGVVWAYTESEVIEDRDPVFPKSEPPHPNETDLRDRIEDVKLPS